MAHYELQKFEENRWVIDAVFNDRATAIDDARALVSRSRGYSAVRVIKVEEQRAGTGFVESVIYNKSAKVPRRYRSRNSAARKTMRNWAQAPQDLAPASRPGAPARAASGYTPATLLLAALLVGSVLIVKSGVLSHPHDAWVFDRPEAQQPNPIRNPWSGEVSH